MIRNLPLDVYYVGQDDPVKVEAIAPDFVRWERATDSRLSDLSTGAALDDFAHLAFYALKREGRTEHTKLDRWLDGVAWIDPDVAVDEDPTPPGP